ncbi:MAG: MarP family serine protease [Gaiellaceae bacterium]
MTTVDWIAVAVIAVTALNGLRRGLVVGAFALVGIVAGAYAGAKLAPELLSGDSAYTPLVSLAGAVVLGTLLRSAAGMAGGAVRSSLLALPPLRALDTMGGLVLGAGIGLALVWVGGAVALHVPGQTELREEVQRSRILREINRQVPPSRLLDAIARVDLLDRIAGPQARVAPPDPALLRDPGVHRARASVLRVTGTACGLGVQGSAWVARRGLLVTNAHVVAGMRDARVEDGEGDGLPARVVHFDPRNDVAVLDVDGLEARPLALVDPVEGSAVAILGYPENGPFTATPGRIGQTGSVLADDAYGRGPVERRITTLRGVVRQGNSGGPAVDGQGRVQATIFAARIGSPSGYGVPTAIVRAALAESGREVSSGPCVR